VTYVESDAYGAPRRVYLTRTCLADAGSPAVYSSTAGRQTFSLRTAAPLLSVNQSNRRKHITVSSIDAQLAI